MTRISRESRNGSSIAIDTARPRHRDRHGATSPSRSRESVPMGCRGVSLRLRRGIRIHAFDAEGALELTVRRPSGEACRLLALRARAGQR
jgi:hypothetical protein